MSDLVTSENVAILRKAFEDHDGFELTLAEFMNTMNRVVLQQRAMDIGKKVTRAEEVAFAKRFHFLRTRYGGNLKFVVVWI